MPNVATLTIGINANTRDLVTGLNSASVQVTQFAKGIGITGVALGNLASRGIEEAIQGVRRLADVMREGVSIAGDFRETMNRFNAVFGEQSEATRMWAEGFAGAVGRFRGDLANSAASFQAFFVGLGLGESEAAGLSKQLTQLAVDFASFNNLSDEEAIERFISALSGSSEVMDKFGVNIRQASLQQELLSQGIDKSWASVTEQEKAMARLSIIVKTMGRQGAIGDAIRTSGSYANQMKALNAALMEAKLAIGEALIPSLREALPAIIELTKAAGAAFVAFMKQAIPATNDVKSAVTEMVQAATAVMPHLANAVNLVLSQFEGMAGVVMGALSPVVTAIGLLDSKLAELGINTGMNMKQFAADFNAATQSIMQDAGQRFRSAITGETGQGVREALQEINNSISNFTPEEITPPNIGDLPTTGGSGNFLGNALDMFNEGIDEAVAKWGPIGQRLTDSVRTPFDRLVESIREAKWALAAGAIDVGTYARVMDKLRGELVKTGDQAIATAGGVGAVTEGSFDAYSAIQESLRARQAAIDAETQATFAEDQASKEFAAAIKAAMGDQLGSGSLPTKQQDDEAKRREVDDSLLDWLKKTDGASREQTDWLQQAVARLDEIKRTFEQQPPLRVVGR